MRRFVLAIILSVMFLPLRGQNLRTVRGLVADESGFPVSGAVLKVGGFDGEFSSDRMGRFEFKVPLSCTTMTAYKDGYPTAKAEINGTYVLVRLSKNVPAAQTVTKPVQQTPAVVEKPEETAVSEVPAATKPEQKPQEERKAREHKPKGISDDAGFACSFDVSYLYSFRTGVITHTNIGERKYGALHPLELSCSMGYRFNKTFTLFAGAGFMYNLLSPDLKDSIDEATYPDVRLRRFDVPVHIGLKASFCKGIVRPFVLAQGGIYALSLAPYAEVGLGVGFRTGGTTAVNLLLSARSNPWPYFTADSFNGYPFDVAPAVKLGFSF